MLVRLLGNEKYQGITIPMSAIFLSLLAGAVIILSLGKNPLSAYGNLLQARSKSIAIKAQNPRLLDASAFPDL